MPPLAQLFDCHNPEFVSMSNELLKRCYDLFGVDGNGLWHEICTEDWESVDTKYKELYQLLHGWFIANGYDPKYRCFLKVWW